MKKVLILALAVLSLASCKKDDDTKPSSGTSNNGGNNNGNNQGNVNPDAVGQWLHGTFSMTTFWTYNGSYIGNPFQQSVAFDFKSNGDYEMYYAGETSTGFCTNDAFSYFKGYVNFTDSSFTVHPTSGRFRGYYSCTSQYNFDRAAAASELTVKTYYYSFETDSNGKKWMVIRFDPADQYPSYFGETNW